MPLEKSSCCLHLHAISLNCHVLQLKEEFSKIEASLKTKPGARIYKRKKESEQEGNHARVHEKRTWPRKHARTKELAQENTHSSKKASTKKRTVHENTHLYMKKIIFKLGEILVNFTFNNFV